MPDKPGSAALTELCGAHCGTDSRGTSHCALCHAGLCEAARGRMARTEQAKEIR